MLVASSFDLWQKDAFFSAAEEVQESADILESAYRTWVSVKRDGIPSVNLEDLRRELQTALGTAKWQLDEFEKAVRSSYGNCREQNNMARHQQFIVAIESQISRAEDALRESLIEEGKQPFRWVNLNEDERDDLAMFLSGFSGTQTKSTGIPLSSERGYTHKKQDLDLAPCSSSYSSGSNIQRKGLSSTKDEIVINMGQADSVMELTTSEADITRSAKRTLGMSKLGSLNILIPSEDDTQNLMGEIEVTPKERGSRLSNFLRFRVLNYISKSLRRSSGSKMLISRRLQSGPSIRLLIILIVSFFLLVPYLLQ